MAKLAAERFRHGPGDESPDWWKEIFLAGIPKETKLRQLDKWRLISLTSVTQLVLRPAIGLLSRHRRPSGVHTWI